MKEKPPFCSEYITTQGERDANKASLMGHLIPSKRHENLEMKISFCTKKKKKKA